ncbi:NEUL4-like protein [Mya arenaria]|uniref:NEUL4-like protein n=1 Tax=Mya arenaria TaxID=6604 RepID=A0ABY7EW51_MYAAR|nr:NEUL4-like protein [Mya arenaria]
MSGSSVLKDGHSMIEEYGCDLDQLSEGDIVGVMRSASGELHFFVNGADQGPAATGIPPNVFAVIDMYGKCAQVSIIESSDNRVTAPNTTPSEMAHQLANEFLAQLSSQIVNDLTRSTNALNMTEDPAVQSNERLTFHERCGSLVKLTSGRRTAERRRPLDEFNNGVVMTNRPLRDEEIFEIRLDRLVDKWSGSIEVGITTHNPSAIDFPATMTNMRSGTIMMSGCGILTNGKGTRREYGQYNLDALAEGDRIGLIRKTNGSLNYFINGVDQGMASNTCPQVVWGVVDLYGMAVKVTILDRTDPNYNHVVNSRAPERQRFLRQFPDLYDEENTTEEEVERLTFHTRCGTHAAVIGNSRTAHRPNAVDDFNNGVVLTARTIRPNEHFEVRLDKMVDKWAGSIEIGLTLHTPESLEFPSTMTNIRSGTWMMTGNGVMYNGTTVLDDYGQNLDRLKVGDRVGVIRKDTGTVHFFVNGIDMGAAASNVPENVYGVIDLYGQAAQATIVDQSDNLSTPDVDFSSLSETDLLLFHNFHGTNSAITNSGRTSIRPNATGEFNDAIVMSNRQLKDNELFEVIIERMVDRWSGSIEAGVTLIKPEDLEFPNTMTDIEYDTWMLSGSAIMQDGSTIRNGYPLDLDSVVVGCRIGMMRCSDGTLHYFLNGVDQGVACSNIPQGVFAVIDLYGQCAQVSITSGSGVMPNENNLINRAIVEQSSLSSPLASEIQNITHRFSMCCGKNISLTTNSCTATRSHNFNNGLIFSSDPLKKDEIFEIRVEKINKQWSGGIRIGLTSMAISDTTPVSAIPTSVLELTAKPTWIVCGENVKKSGVTIKENYAPSLERLEVGNKIGIRRSQDGAMHVYLNGENLGIAASSIPRNVFAVIDLYGMVESVSVVSSVTMVTDSSTTTPSVDSETGHQIVRHIDRDQDRDTASSCVSEFHCNHGKNIRLSNGNLTITRTASYNQGVAVTSKPLARNHLFKVRIDKLNTRWSSSMMIGYVGFSPEKFSFPVSAMAIKKSCVLVHSDHVYSCGAKIKENYGPNLNSLQVGQTVGVLVDEDHNLHMYVDGLDQGIAARDVPTPCHGLLDLYGQCEQVTIIAEGEDGRMNQLVVEDREKADIDDVVKEKVFRPLGDQSTVSRPCEYQNLCQRIKTQLSLPEGYFDTASHLCYCEQCHKLRGDELYCRKGDPPKEYASQFGWSLFKLRLPGKASMLAMSEKWHVAYFGSKVESLRKILDTGDLHATVFTEKSQPDGSSVNTIVLSPTLRYAGANEFSPKNKVIDPKTKKAHHVRVAFQVCVKPGSYKVGPQSIGANEPIDPQIGNGEIEWSTKERGSHGATLICLLGLSQPFKELYNLFKGRLLPLRLVPALLPLNQCIIMDYILVV